jgi:hypothetical protein
MRQKKWSMRIVSPRDKWKMSFRRCFFPGCKSSDGQGETHEIIGGSDRHKTVKQDAFWIIACRHCHDKLGSRPNEASLIEQLAVKLWNDPEHYNLVAVMAAWRPNATAGYVSEVSLRVMAEYRRIMKEYA